MIMNKFFGHDIDYSKAVTLFSIHHLIYVLFGLTTIIVVLRYAEKIKASSFESRFKTVVAFLLIIMEIMYHIHNWTYPRLSIPLHICSFATFMAIYILFTDNERIFKYLFFFGTLGGIMALTIPLSLGYTYYNFRYYHFIILHCTIIFVPLYYYKAYHYRIIYKDVLNVFKGILVMAVIIHLINSLFIHFGIESNYWYITTIPSNVDHIFTIHPIYVIIFMSAVFATMNLLYFVTKDEYTEQRVNKLSANKN